MTQTLTTEQRIRQTAAALANSAGWASLALLRAMLADIPRNELDATLRAMSRSQSANLVPGANQKTLTDADHAAALRIGMDLCHYIAITG